MAQKRMFDKSIIETDEFMDMTMSTKALYFLLGMEADDEGFVSPKRVMRIYGGSDDDLKILVAKNYCIAFKSGVVVITNWHENNYLDKKRVKETRYQAEKKLLALTNGKYTMLNNGLTNVKQMLRENRIEENRIEENRIEQNSIDNTITSNEVNQIIEYFNSLFSTKFRVTPERSKKIKLRLKTYKIEEIKKAIYNLSKSKFHNGENDRGWRATIDFITRNDEKIDEFLNSSLAKTEDIIITKKPYFMGKPLSKDMKFVIWSKGDIREFAGDKKDIVWK